MDITIRCLIILLFLCSVAYANGPYGYLEPQNVYSELKIPKGTALQLKSITGMEDNSKYEVIDGNTRTDCVTGGGPHKVECCYDETISKWEHCIAGTNPLTPLLSDFAGKGLQSFGGQQFIDLKPETFGAYIISPVATDYNDVFWWYDDITILYVWCKTYSAGGTETVTLNIEDGDDNDILNSDIVCDADGEASTDINLSYDNITGKTEDVDVSITSITNSPTKVTLYLGVQQDD